MLFESIRYPILIISGLMISFGICQTLRFRNSWLDVAKHEDVEKRDRLFYERQYRRRMQIGFLIILSGLGIFIGFHLPITDNWKYFFLCTWFLTFLFICWTVLLAILDIISIKMYFARIQRSVNSEAAKLRYEMYHKAKSEKQENPKNSEENE